MKQAMASALVSLHASTKRRYEIAVNALKYPHARDRVAEYEEVRDELKKRLNELEEKINQIKKES